MALKASLLAITASMFVVTGIAKAQNLRFDGLPAIQSGGGGLPPPPIVTSDVEVSSDSISTGNGFFLPLSEFASQRDLAATQAQLNSTLTHLDTVAAQIRADVIRVRRRSSEGISLAAAMAIVPPNPGDRFSVTFTGAGFDNQGGGSVNGAYRAADRVLLFGGYARGSTQNLFRVGVSFSFN